MRAIYWLTRIVAIAGIVVMGGLLAAVVGYAIAPHSEVVLTAVEKTRPIEEPFDLTPGTQRSEVYDSQGNLMEILRFDVDREIVELDAVPQDVIDTVLATEDEKFYEHNGVDVRGTLRALLSNVTVGGITQGGSTITQQIVKLRIVGSDRTLERKTREAIVASRLEEEFTKDELLHFYLNEIYFGNGAYGVQAAAETYFGKNVGNLDVGDAAFLAGMIRQPSIFDGFVNGELARTRRDLAIDRAVEVGVISADEGELYMARPLPDRNRSPQQTEALRRDYFIEEIKDELLELDVLGETRADRFNAVFNGVGLRVFTTFRPDIQQMAEAAKREVFPDGTGEFEVSFAVFDHNNGAVLAFLGGPNFDEEQFNLATQGFRQPGSSFKVYVLTAALEQGTVPNDTISGQGPCIFKQPEPQEPYEVENFGNSGGSVGSIHSQTLASSNCAFVRLGIHTGLEHVADTAGRMVGRSPDEWFDPFPSMSLGAQEVTPLEHAAGIGVLANDGIRMEPYYIERIEDRDGNIIYQHRPRGLRVVSERTARIVTHVLRANVQSGTGRRAQLPEQPAAGKTGTAQNFEDAWFAGFTPYYSVAVWMGNPEEKVPMRNVFGGVNVTGGRFPAMVWAAFMRRAHEGLPVIEFPERPSTRAGKLIFLPDEKCRIEIEINEQRTEKFVVPCALVSIDAGDLIPKDSALCEIEIPGDDGVARKEKVPCTSVREILTTTTTTSTSTTVAPGTSQPPPPTTGPPPPPTTGPPPPTTTSPPPPPTTTSVPPPPTTTTSAPPPTTTTEGGGG